MLILPAEADESVVTSAVGHIARIAGDHGGEVTNMDRWGRRRFAFEIDHLTEGYYVVVTFTAEPEAQSELDRVLNLADEVIRHKVLVLPAKRPQKTDTEPTAASPAPA
jgi:small subunit ribosomal protein S6